jgi:glycosyltransferase involved in cell wall biosynthesis
MGVIGKSGGQQKIIPHGVHERFTLVPRTQAGIREYSVAAPLRIAYVSNVDLYKHQWMAVEAVGVLRSEGLPVSLDLIGPAYPVAMRRLTRALRRIDRAGEFVRYVGAVPHDKLHEHLANTDIFLFASSCENMPNALLEAMASGLPIACSDREPMPEVLGDAGVYFDPENPSDIARALRELVASPEIRCEKAQAAFERALSYPAKGCTTETFRFLRVISEKTAAVR